MDRETALFIISINEVANASFYGIDFITFYLMSFIH